MRCSKADFIIKYLGLGSVSCSSAYFPYIDKVILASMAKLTPQAAFKLQSTIIDYPIEKHTYANEDLNYENVYFYDDAGTNQVNYQLQNAKRESKAIRLNEHLSDLIGDLAGVLTTETINKFTNIFSDIIRYIVSRTSRILLRESEELVSFLISTLRNLIY